MDVLVRCVPSLKVLAAEWPARMVIRSAALETISVDRAGGQGAVFGVVFSPLAPHRRRLA
ncbi:hypothetical protein Arub01_43240 [Actinomadura rubrobrunea]|uniref:Uncharacterized protein n=1 Tax=Actinomadura rubrobrunea TaxID=115335 RepID=A0A9W6UYU9_9ACTN|nr:hypothetical protein Arub01_43240 [Actinomadura rubrobrunea]